jgi:hypothetical protein
MSGPTTSCPLSDPPSVTASEGFVLLDHPAGLAITLTSDAAAATGQKLLDAAAEASGQTEAGEDAPTSDESR